MDFSTSANGEASVRIVVPARNEERFIDRCLQSLQQQRYPAEKVEILVVDNGSVDRTISLAERRGVRVMQRLGVLVGGVRNAGAEGSNADVIAFIDADCVAGPDWLRSAVGTLSDPSVGVVGGRYIPNPEGTWVERAWKTSRIPEAQKVPALPGGSMIFRRRVFEAVNGFDEELSAGEDDDICRKVRALALSVMAIPECYVVHLGYPDNLLAIAKRQIWHGSYQLDVAESAVEPQLILTHATLFGCVILLLGILGPSIALTGVGAGLFLLAPVVLAARRVAGRSSSFRVFWQLFLIGIFFYSGRAIGLIKNYQRKLVG